METKQKIEYYDEDNRSAPVDLEDWFENHKIVTEKDLLKDKNLPLDILTLCYEHTPKPAAYWILKDMYRTIPAAERHFHISKMLMAYVDFICVTDTKELFYYNSNEGIFCDGGEDIVEEFSYVFDDPMRVAITKEVINRTKVLSYMDRKFLNKENLLAVENGVLNLYDESGITFEPHSRDFLLTKKIHVVYDEEAICSQIDTFISQIVGEEDISLLEDMIGYTLTPDHKFHKFFIMLGDGANGKSTLLSLIGDFLGHENVCNVLLNDLADSPYHAATLYGKMANIVADLPYIPVQNTSVLKAMTGGDWIQVRKIYGHPFSFQNHAKMIYSCNQLPQIVFDDSHALWRRVVLIDFPNKFEGENRDPDLLKKLTAPEELSGFLNMALWALQRLLKRGCFEKDDETNIGKTRDRYQMKSDTTQSFINNVLELNLSGLELKSEVDNAYDMWCAAKVKGVIPDSQKVFTYRLKQLMGTVKIVKRMTPDGTQRHWMGFNIKKEWAFLKLKTVG